MGNEHRNRTGHHPAGNRECITQRHDRPPHVLWRAGCSGMGKSGSEGRGEQTTARTRGIGGSPLTLPPVASPPACRPTPRSRSPLRSSTSGSAAGASDPQSGAPGSGSSTTCRCARSSCECPRPESSSPFSAPVAFVHTVVISWRRSIGRHVSSIANVDVVPAADVAGFRTYRDSDAGTGSTRRDRVSRTGRPRHVRGRSVAGREARRPLTCPPTRQAEADELPPAIPCRASTPLRARLVAASWR